MNSPRRIFALWCAILCLGLVALSAQSEESMSVDQAAVSAYRAGDVETARTLWTEELGTSSSLSDEERARLAYNLGNACAREGRSLEAVAWYSASLRLRPRDEDTWANLELARLEAGLSAADRGDLGATLERLLSSLTSAESSWLALMALVPLGLALAFEALRGGRLWRWISLAALVLAVLAALPWVHHRIESGRDPVMIVSEDAISIRSEPRSDAGRVAELETGEIVERVDVMSDWTAVELSGHRRGWLLTEAVFALRR